MKKLGLLLILVIAGVSASYSQPTAATFTIKNFRENTEGTALMFDIWGDSKSANAKVGNSHFDFNVTGGAFDTTRISVTSNVLTGSLGYSLSGVFINKGTISIKVSFTGNNAYNISNAYGGIYLMTVTLYIVDHTKTAGLSWNKTTEVKTPNNNYMQLTLLGAYNQPLPVELKSFSVKRYNTAGAQLYWATASEINNYGFYIERSTDGKYWQVITFIPSQSFNGNSQQVLQYTYIDEDVYKPTLQSSVIYYRIRQQDFNGDEEYVGGVKSVRFINTDNMEQMYSFGPNPAKAVLFIYNYSGAEMKACVIDLGGKIVLFEQNTEDMQLNISHLKAGPYMLLLKNASGETLGVQKLIITP